MPQVPVDSSDGSQPKTVAATITPSADLLDRALAGWERFLSTFEAASDE
ncbi:hypothetical protein [Streptomyces sp. NBC_00091]|nr:hypothetical protein [Streptomyces sp. NBC_00091]MCX5376037.1 hypothetical protein [Streptomyces sp. NBC_00091]